MRRILSTLPLLLILHCLPAQTPESPLVASFTEYQEHRAQTPFRLKWQSLGPVLNSARVEAVQLDHTRPGTMYVAFGSGNLWKTTDNGLSWRPLFENQPAQGIGDIALAPSNPEVIYLGTGESLRKNRNFTMPGTGVYRSDDGGDHWRYLGLPDSWHTGEIAVHPGNPDIAYVAVLGRFWSRNANRGIYRTMNGGQTWEHVLYVNDQTGGNDIVIAPSNPNILYASTWEFDPDRPLAESVFGPESGVYRSADGGQTWTRLTNGLPTGARTGRIGLAVSHADPDKVYALIDNCNKYDRNRTAEVYRSLDGGLSWTRTHDQDLMIFPGIGWYFADIYVNPQNDEEIFTLGVRLAHSRDGGRNFDLIGGRVTHLQPSPAQTLHLDHCELWINPQNPDHLALGNDGGFYVSYDRGQSWLHHNNIPAGEFYDVTVDQQDPYLIYAGAQDDATVYGPAREWDGRFNDPWRYLWIDAWSGGDGCVTQVDPTDPNTVYFSLQEGYVLRKDMRADTSVLIAPKAKARKPRDLIYQFITPYFISPHQPQTLYHAGNYVYKTTNRGDDWELISPDLSLSADSTKSSIAAGALAESPLRPGLLYAGTDRGAFWVSENDGKNWREHSRGLPNYYIRSICPSRFRESRVYLAMSGLNYDHLDAHLFVSEDFGQTWTSLRANLSNETVNVILEDPKYEDILYAGAYRGVYISMDRGRSWSLLGMGMPNVSVADLEIQQRENDLIAGTHGRGIYKLDLDPIHRAFVMGYPLRNNFLFRIPTVETPRERDTHGDIDEQTVQKVPITFWLSEAGPVRIEVRDEGGEMMWSKTLAGEKGFNQFWWDLATHRRESDLPYFIHYRLYLPAGNYTVRLQQGSEALEEPWMVQPH